MAHAQINPAETKVVEVAPATVTLTLSIEEAETLRAVTCHIGGHPERSRRKYMDNIRLALAAAGFTKRGKDTVCSHSVYFQDTL